MILKFIRRLISFLIRKLNLADLDGFIYQRRLDLASKVDKMHKSTIQFGPFKDMILSDGDWWGKIDRPSMIYGFYEKEVLESLTSSANEFKLLIDIGAADGYYAIGALMSNKFQKSICYEISKDGQKQIKKNAELNDVHDRIEIRGEARKGFYNEFSDEELASSLILMDIEGGEFDLFSERQDFLKVSKATLIIESHALHFKDGEDRQKNLLHLAEEFFDITEFKTSSRDLSTIPSLKKFSDSDRWLICSEGRGELMSWFRLDPK
ncbi:hypothetical protein N9L56_00140 [Gammaproteobacteria bacterium]|mgnify:CR=1 FL=1|nr:hypothetical protein [Gammaproteobacteria bacterium]